jgi:hypothetical protein
MIKRRTDGFCIELRRLIEIERLVAVRSDRLAGEVRPHDLRVGIVPLSARHGARPLVHRANAARHEELVDEGSEVLQRRRLEIRGRQGAV